ncbi:MAG: JAB domain-containing protein [Bacteroidota bacterium]
MIIKEFSKRQINSSRDVAELCSKILRAEESFDQDKEHFWGIGLDSQNKIKYLELITLGLLNQGMAHARELFRLAIMTPVVSVIICHNHPAGNVAPSPEDKEITRKIVEAGKIIGIQLLDHVIIGKSGHYSFSDDGLI